MKMARYIFALILLLTLIPIWSQEPQKNISLQIPTINDEATSIWKTTNNIEFFETYGYKVNLPKDKLVETLLSKSKSGIFSNNDYSSIYNLLESKVYDKGDYQIASNKVLEQEKLLNSMVLQLKSIQENWNWDFKIYENYTVLLTLYGSGGSYDPDKGKVILFVTKDGNFKRYANPVNTIIHEIIHIGIEDSIVKKYNLSHSFKENIVDTIVWLCFKEFLPEYKIQNMGSFKIGNYFNSKEDIKGLDKIVEKYITELGASRG